MSEVGRKYDNKLRDASLIAQENAKAAMKNAEEAMQRIAVTAR